MVALHNRNITKTPILPNVYPPSNSEGSKKTCPFISNTNVIGVTKYFLLGSKAQYKSYNPDLALLLEPSSDILLTC